jgi:hypothetical protein
MILVLSGASGWFLLTPRERLLCLCAIVFGHAPAA